MVKFLEMVVPGQVSIHENILLGHINNIHCFTSPPAHNI